MIRTIAITKTHQIVKGKPIEEILSDDYLWYWIDFDQPAEEEIAKLRSPLNFHPLAIEDCIHTLQRPKLDYYDEYTFFVMHCILPYNLEKEELNLFLGETYTVTFHHSVSKEIDEIWNRLEAAKDAAKWDPYLILYHVLDKIVDNYFPIIYQLEDELNHIEANSTKQSMEDLLEGLFAIRHDLLAMRHSVTPMSELVYRMLNSHRLTGIKKKTAYFSDIYDHLLKISSLIDASREITADIRDSYLSMNAHQTNKVMKVLTVITTIFMPLTLIAGIYGMNFKYMPELEWKPGYFFTLGLMVVISSGMWLWFTLKGWFK
ncbi:magnesium/cobalt transporter CorA [Heyndrickxia acidicola]|uniref:Magnesium transport protein CorA n=1 Tax=Heyndrickxia acidicola TaxID=209389 RepID=A0ABU6MFC6_9BACI|nr:magnesium/cobalt transporter CorA [Heyndrickxia acidicola]MED1202393.1 magnesium/cobalt transporter CorA [Heyndrickxia acidicola]